ncbi:MAG: hypothetical protein AB1806_07560 [Acidobacteriota bacterium]
MIYRKELPNQALHPTPAGAIMSGAGERRRYAGKKKDKIMTTTSEVTASLEPRAMASSELSDFEREYFTQTRKEIDTEKQERNKILNYGILATGAMSVAFARSGSIADLASPAALVIYFPLLLLVSVLVQARRIKLRQISDRWHALRSLLAVRGCCDAWTPLEQVVCRGLRGRRYLAEDFCLHLGLSSVVYCLIGAVVVPLLRAGSAARPGAIAAGLGAVIHLGVTSFWLWRPVKIPMEYADIDEIRRAATANAA